MKRWTCHLFTWLIFLNNYPLNINSNTVSIYKQWKIVVFYPETIYCFGVCVCLIAVVIGNYHYWRLTPFMMVKLSEKNAFTCATVKNISAIISVDFRRGCFSQFMGVRLWNWSVESVRNRHVVLDSYISEYIFLGKHSSYNF